MGNIMAAMANQLVLGTWGMQETGCPQILCTAAAAVGSRPWAGHESCGCKVASLRKDKSNGKREHSATGSVWLLLYVEDFQGLSSETR